MKKEFFNRIEKVEQDGSRQFLAYYLLTGWVSEEYCDLVVYGAEIDREITYADGKRERDKKVIPDLFFVRDEAQEFLQKIFDNEVTPTELKYAIREYIGEKLKNVKSV